MGLSSKIVNKDWSRMQTMIRQEGATTWAGENVADKITNKDKALARFVAGMKLAGRTIEDFAKYLQFGSAKANIPFLSFWEKAKDLGATPDEVLDLYERFDVPEEYSDGNEKIKMTSTFKRWKMDPNNHMMNKVDVEENDDWGAAVIKKFDRYKIPIDVKFKTEGWADNNTRIREYIVTLFPDDDFSKLKLFIYAHNGGHTWRVNGTDSINRMKEMGIYYGMNLNQLLAAVKTYLGI
jgi:hypothetical protein